jgi:glycosyltransferase involved in cell wall biosynthesis
VRKKGVDTLLHAFARVLRDCPQLTLATVGDGPLLDEHRRLASSLGIENHVTFVGPVSHGNIAPFYSGCELFVLPSRDEPFGLVLLEAAQQKKAIVCTRVGGVPEIVSNGVDGVIVEADDPAAMALEIVGLIRDPARREILGRQAQQTLLTRFLWADRIHDYLAVYEGRAAAVQLSALDVPHPADSVDRVRREPIDVMRAGQ